MTTHTELFEVGVGEALATSPQLSEEALRAEGGNTNALLSAGAAMGQEVAYRDQERFAALYLDTATGEALRRLVHDRYCTQWQGATAAVGEVTLTRSTSGSDVTVTAGTVIRTSDGIRYSTDEDVTLSAGVTSASVAVTSLAAGSDQNVAAGTLTAFEGAKPWVDMTVTNAARTAGGNEGESDEALRSRARSFFVNARRATLAAIEQGALGVPQVREAAAYEQLDADGNETGAVTLVIADESGDANGTLTGLVETALEEWRPAGVAVVVMGGTRVERDIAVTIVWRAGQATSANRQLVRQAIIARVNALRANGAPTADEAPVDSWLTPGLIEQAARNVPGVIGVTVTDPAGIEKPDHGEVFRAGEVTVS